MAAAAPPPSAAPVPATTAVPATIPPPPAATAPPPSAARDAFVKAAPWRVLIAVPVLAAPSKPAEPAAAAIAGAATNAIPPVAVAASTAEATGFSFTVSSTACAASPTCFTAVSPAETNALSPESIPRPIDSKISHTLINTPWADCHYRKNHSNRECQGQRWPDIQLGWKASTGPAQHRSSFVPPKESPGPAAAKLGTIGMTYQGRTMSSKWKIVTISCANLTIRTGT